KSAVLMLKTGSDSHDFLKSVCGRAGRSIVPGWRGEFGRRVFRRRQIKRAFVATGQQAAQHQYAGNDARALTDVGCRWGWQSHKVYLLPGQIEMVYEKKPPEGANP